MRGGLGDHRTMGPANVRDPRERFPTEENLRTRSARLLEYLGECPFGQKNAARKAPAGHEFSFNPSSEPGSNSVACD